MRKNRRITLGKKLHTHTWVRFPTAYLYARLPDGAKSLLGYLLHLHYQRRPYPGDATAAEKLHCSTRSIRRWLQPLKNAHIVSESRDPDSGHPTLTLNLPTKLPPFDGPEDVL